MTFSVRLFVLPLLFVVIPVAVLLGSLAFNGCSKAKNEAGKHAAAPVVVKAAAVEKKSMPLQIKTFGTVEAMAVAVVKPQIGGIITNIHFTEGLDVKAGDLLFSIDARLFENAMRQAEAVLARDAAQLRNAEAEAKRQDELLAKGLTSADVCEQAKATAISLAATVNADSAAADNARLQVEYCSVKAPIGGRTGRRTVDAGNVVKANEQALVTILQLQPVYVAFSVPHKDVPEILTRKGQPMPVVVTVPGSDGTAHEAGVVTFVDSAVDKTTGTLFVRATQQNQDQRLVPGQFVNVTMTLGVEPDVLVVPSVAVQAGQAGMFVFVVKADSTVENRPVKVARTCDQEMIIASGLEAGETVVIDGHLRLGPGVKVNVKQVQEQDGPPKS